MVAMDDPTARFYARNASDLAERYESVESSIARYFGVAFTARSRVLDVGAGSGRDLAALLRDGFDAFGVEPIDELRAEAIKRHAELQDRLLPGELPAIGKPFGGQYDGLLCSAVLMHVPEVDLFDAVFAMRGLLKPHGRLLISLPLARNDIGADGRDASGRLFSPYTAEHLQLLFERVGFQQIGRWDDDDALGRTGTRWFTLLFELRIGSTVRAIDQIEGILNRDRKVATYKLALFRALAELATQEPRGVRWRPDGTVGVAIKRVAEKWLGYYWPIFASPTFIPQSQSEGAGTVKHLAFRRALTALMAGYQASGPHGGLAAWQQDLQAGRLSAATMALLDVALRSIASAIRLGPVDFSGGSLETGKVFGYDSATAEISMSADLWREFSLQGHWISDAVVLRWATLTERFGQRQGIRSSDVLPLLLARAEPERATHLARQVYKQRGLEVCVWSGRRLGANFAVDHVIPFALWGCNDLWNLLPSAPAVNNQKSDKLPSAALMRERQQNIIRCWEVLRDEAPIAFDQQAVHLLGRKLSAHYDWQQALFARLREAVEVTAIQRGVERWTPRPIAA